MIRASSEGVEMAIKKMRQILDSFRPHMTDDEMAGLCAGYAAACMMELKALYGATAFQQVMDEVNVEILGLVRDEHKGAGHS